MTRQKKKLSGFQTAENELKNTLYPWTVGFMTRQKLHHVFHDRRNRIFRTPKCRKWTHTKVSSLEPGVSRLGKVALSGLKQWRKSTQTKRSTLEQWVTRLGKNRIFMTLECKIELTRKYVPLNRLFKESAEIAFSGRQSAENPWTVGITIRQKSHIKVAKKQQRAHTKLGTLETWVSRLGKNSGLKNEENLLTLNEGLIVSRLDRNRVFRPPSAGSVCICSFAFRTCREKQCSRDELVQRK